MAPGEAPKAPVSQKRKASQSLDTPNRKIKYARLQNARVIAAQTSDSAFKDGEVNVEKFVKARQFEIKALEDSMKTARSALSSRAFQSVPRELRRRTASHNVKRVPKRLRTRAKKEMAEDNTPNTKKKILRSRNWLRRQTIITLKRLSAGRGKRAAEKLSQAGETGALPKIPKVKANRLQDPPRPKARFRKRQINKTWLPTHVYHAKRAHMTPPLQPLWRMAIPLTPTVKSYRPSHRASRLRGAIAWDTSYMSTIGLEGAEASLMTMLKSLGIGKDAPRFWKKDTSRFVRGTRSWSGWTYETESSPPKPIALVTVLWCVESEEPQAGQGDSSVNEDQRRRRRKVFVRVHPSAFVEVWQEMLRISKSQNLNIRAEDLRFEIGSVELQGPAATEILVGALQPISSTDSSSAVLTPEQLFPLLLSAHEPQILPSNVLLGLDVSDPRLLHPHRKPPVPADPQHALQAFCDWPADTTQPAAHIFSRVHRLAASRQLPSQKAINRRRTLAAPGALPVPQPNDPQIPILLYATASSWHLLLPWRCVLPVWYMFMYYPLSSGGTARLGGLDQTRQLAFERGLPWFPGDFPGTKAGMEWERREREHRKAEWERKPKGRRVEFDNITLGPGRKGEIGRGWACDWEFLVEQRQTDKSKDTGGDTEMADESEKMATHVPSALAAAALKGGPLPSPLDQHLLTTLVTVRIRILAKGVPSPCARIYRLPTTNKSLRERFLALLHGDPLPLTASKKGKRNAGAANKNEKKSKVERRRALAARLLEPPLKAGDAEYPPVPGEKDLIGFVTAGNFNLAEGQGTGIGSVMLGKVLEAKEQWGEKDSAVCIVRDAGQTVGRLARWEII